MTYGIDTNFLIAVEVMEHSRNRRANALLDEILEAGNKLALAPQTMAEFIHVVTDARRFPRPLTMLQALERAENWWNAREVTHVFPMNPSTTDFFGWVREHRLGRKRLLDTLLASTLRNAEVRHLITNNAEDFRVFGWFELVGF
jgi:predicted nucleic acid-binding protein